jgi:hypothetical protein
MSGTPSPKPTSYSIDEGTPTAIDRQPLPIAMAHMEAERHEQSVTDRVSTSVTILVPLTLALARIAAARDAQR